MGRVSTKGVARGGKPMPREARPSTDLEDLGGSLAATTTIERLTQLLDESRKAE